MKIRRPPHNAIELCRVHVFSLFETRFLKIAELAQFLLQLFSTVKAIFYIDQKVHMYICES
jgi:hypothetical protein